MAKTTWSSRKINSLIVEYDGLSINKIEEWSVVARASLQKIKEWTGFPDILVPFVMSMSEVQKINIHLVMLCTIVNAIIMYMYKYKYVYVCFAVKYSNLLYAA